MPMKIKATKSKAMEPKVTFVYSIVVLLLVHVQVTYAVCDLTKGCFPKFFNILKNIQTLPTRNLTVSSVCGTNGAEQYWTFLDSDSKTYTCDPTAVPLDNMLDGNSATYWQSTVGTTGQEVETRFTDEFLLFEIVVRFAVPHLTDRFKSADARPPGWKMEKLEDDGTTWKTLRYFAKDCASTFPGIPILDPFSNNDYKIAYCQQYQAVDSTDAFNDGLNTIAYYPGLLDDYLPYSYRNDPDVAKHFSTKAVRLNFVNMVRPGLDKQNYVSIHDFIVDVRCQCNGHAETCSGLNQATCDCQHFTTGQQCDTCLPLYNNQSWSHGDTSSAGACQKCSCNSHASSCVYDSVKKYGVCQDCTDNTAGDFCDTCATGHYINSSWASANDVNNGGAYCLPCQCDPAGTLPTQLTTCDINTGQCSCKTNVQGRDCSECKDTFYGLTASNALGCTACICNPAGTIGDNSMCNKTDGACLCRNNVKGTSCDTCKTNTYGFSAKNADGCLDCACDSGGSVGPVCNLATGDCTCRTNIGSRDCKIPNAGNFVPRLDLIILEPERSISEGVVLRDGHGTKGATNSGRGLVLTTSAKQLDVRFTSDYGGLMDLAVRYEKTTENNLVFLTGSLSLISAQTYSCGTVNVNAGQKWPFSKSDIIPAKTGAVILGQVCVFKSAIYLLELENSGSALLIDSIVLVPTQETLQSSVPGSINAEQVKTCQEEALSTLRQSRDNCKPLEYSLMAAYLNGALACSCTGSLKSPTCDAYSGDCDCKTGVLPPKCDTCFVEYYKFAAATGCIACGCHVNGSINSFCSIEGVCQCHPNVVGNKCDSCATDHFGLHTGKGCSPCQCNPTYAQASNCDDFGQCVCKPGVGGINCDKCDDGHYNLTKDGCTPCGCHAKGSTGVGCDQTTGVCQCRDNVEGPSCNKCKQGFFGLGDWHVGGCIPCYCLGKGDNCTAAPSLFDNPIKTVSSGWPDGWTAANASGSPKGVAAEIGGTMLKVSPLMETGDDLFFMAPAKYKGDRSSSYGRTMSFDLTSVTLPSLTGNELPSTTVDVIMESSFVTKALKFSTTVPLNTTTKQHSFTISMKEESWKVVEKGQQNSNLPLETATFTQLMEVLTSVSLLKIQAYNAKTPGYALMLNSVTLEAASQGPSTSVSVNNVEMCQCQSGYGGKHCEVCATGFTRSTPANQDPSSQCVVCSCNGHANQTCDAGTGKCSTEPCDPVTGTCICTHNTEGNNCQTCSSGYYGNATKGTPDDCLPCACPGIVVNQEANVFSTSCIQNDVGAPVCSNCTIGHTGDHCQTCIDGYYGTPENITNNGGKCIPCQCNGRADTCNPRTGECVNCRNNTAGQQCNICAPQYFGDAMTFSCNECVCKNFPGSTGQCDPSNGHCECLVNVEGNLCDQCKDGAFNLQAVTGCQSCDCHVNGSTSPFCDKTTGTCPCRSLVEGRQCDKCQDSYWNINQNTGCDPCGCNELGTAKSNGVTIKTCDITTGQCTCALPGTIGRTCDSCSPVTKFTLTYVSLFFLGEFPQCRLCGECFDSWGLTVDAIGKESEVLNDKTLAIWQQYGNQSPEQIGSSLTITEEKIQKASDSVGAFEDLAQDLVQLQTRFDQAATKDRVLSSRTKLLTDKEQSLRTRLAVIEALTQMIKLTQSTTTTVSTLQQEMNSYTTNAQAAKRLGVSSWESIQTLSFVVADPAERERQLKQQADSYMSIATLANQTYQLADILYKNNLKSGSEDATENLQNIGQQQLEATTTLTAVESTASQVTATIANVKTALSSLVGASEKSRTETLKMVVDLQEYMTNASAAQRNVQDAQDQANKYLTDAKEAESTMRNSMTTILENLGALTKAQTDLVSSQVRSANILTVSLRPLTDLEKVMADIKSSQVSAADVQAVDLKAQKALVLAEEALQDTQKALGLARDVNQEVVIMEEDIKASQNTRTEATGLKNAADIVKGDIDTILSEVGSHINTTLSDIESVTASSIEVKENVTTIAACLDQGDIKVKDTTASASRSEERAQTTSKNQEVLIKLMFDINSASGDQTVTQALNSLSQGSAILTQVVKDRQQVEAITNLKDLVQDLVAQVQEIKSLDGEINALTTELDDLVLALEENLDGGSCNS